MSTVLQQSFSRWRTVVSATWKYDDPKLNMSHECDMFHWGSSYFHVARTTVRHLLIVVWPTTSCFADWSKRRHVTLRIIDCQEVVLTCYRIFTTCHPHPCDMLTHVTWKRVTCCKYSITCQDDLLTVDNAQSHVTAFRPISEAARSWSDDN